MLSEHSMTNQRISGSGALFAISPPVAERQGYLAEGTCETQRCLGTTNWRLHPRQDSFLTGSRGTDTILPLWTRTCFEIEVSLTPP